MFDSLACPFHFAPKNAFIAQNSEVKSNFARGAGGFRAEEVDIIHISVECRAKD